VFITLLPTVEQRIVMSVCVCLSVCLQGYLSNYTSELHHISVDVACTWLSLIPRVDAYRFVVYFRF